MKDKIVTVYPLKNLENSHSFPDICVAFFSVKNLCLCMNCMINECSSVVNYGIIGNTDNKTKKLNIGEYYYFMSWVWVIKFS